MTGDALGCERFTRSFGKTIALDAIDLAIAPRPGLLLLGDPTAGLDPLPLEEILVAVLRRGGEETHHV
jgi:ABC-type transporter Mla maintaining outer membrane lipid asymmetry ATPase subunit MlaF